MIKHLFLSFVAFFSLISLHSQAQDVGNLSVKTRIDSDYVFGFDLTQSRSAKGGIWSLKEGGFVTPQNYSEAKTDTINGTPVVMLYRQVALGNHPLNGWETWTLKGNQWIRMDESADIKKPKTVNRKARRRKK